MDRLNLRSFLNWFESDPPIPIIEQGMLVCGNCHKPKSKTSKGRQWYCRDCQKLMDEEDNIEMEILCDLCLDLPYSIMFNCDSIYEAIIEPSDNTKILNRKKAHIIVTARLTDATIHLQSMADYRRDMMIALVDLRRPDYKLEFRKTVDRIIKIREIQFFAESNKYREKDEEHTIVTEEYIKEYVNEMKRIVMELNVS